MSADLIGGDYLVRFEAEPSPIFEPWVAMTKRTTGSSHRSPACLRSI